MVLAIDIGNSNIVLGGYKGETACFVARMATNRQLEADQYAVELAGILQLYGVATGAITGIAISSVVPAVTPLVTAALAHFTAAAPHILSLADAGDITVDIENPREIGMDILASALAVCHTRPLPAVIIDMGTATKLTALDRDCRLRGVAIAPGLYLSLNALVSGASAIQGTSLKAPVAAIGRNTVESINSGMVLGTADMLDGMIERFATQLGGANSIVATGGAAPVVIPHCRHQIEYSNTLLLDGLYRAWRAAPTAQK